MFGDQEFLWRRTSRQAPQYMQKNAKVIFSPMSAETDERLPKTQDCMHLPSACSARHVAKQNFVIWVLAMCSKWPAYVARSLRQRGNQRLTYAPLLGNLTCGGRPAYCRTVTSDHHPIPKSKINVASPACIVRLISLISRCSCTGILSTFSVPKGRSADFSAEPHQHTRYLSALRRSPQEAVHKCPFASKCQQWPLQSCAQLLSAYTLATG